MIEIKPKDDPGFGYIFCATLIFLAVVGFLLYANDQINKKLEAIAKAQLVAGQFLNDYVPEVEARFEEVGNQMELVETVAPIYERRVSDIEKWRDETCFTTCG